MSWSASVLGAQELEGPDPLDNLATQLEVAVATACSGSKDSPLSGISEVLTKQLRVALSCYDSSTLPLILLGAAAPWLRQLAEWIDQIEVHSLEACLLKHVNSDGSTDINVVFKGSSRTILLKVTTIFPECFYNPCQEIVLPC